MSYFKYKIMTITDTEKIKTGIIKLSYNDEYSVMSYLESNNDVIVVSVKKLNVFSIFFLVFLKRFFEKKITRKFVADWLNNIALMIKAGIPLISAFEESIEGLPSSLSNFKKDIHDMIMGIQRGNNFSEVIKNKNHIFPKTVFYLIKIGEQTGTLDERLQESAEHLERIQGIISDTKQALLYPVSVFFVLSGAIIFWFYYVVPKIIALFTTLNVKLPVITLMIIQISNFMQNYIINIFFDFFLFITIVIILYKKNQKVRKFMDNLFLEIPIIGKLIELSNLAFITENFALLINAGIDIIQAVEILENSVSNEMFKVKLMDIKISISAGMSIAEAFKQTNFFSRILCKMIKVGEVSGTLSQQLQYVAKDYKKKLAIMVSTLSKTIEPIVLVIAGSIITILIVGLFLPIYGLIGTIS